MDNSSGLLLPSSYILWSLILLIYTLLNGSTFISMTHPIQAPLCLAGNSRLFLSSSQQSPNLVLLPYCSATGQSASLLIQSKWYILRQCKQIFHSSSVSSIHYFLYSLCVWRGLYVCVGIYTLMHECVVTVTLPTSIIMVAVTIYEQLVFSLFFLTFIVC